ncbi:MAG TPA: hypothetical protein VG297_00970 [Bryobacteraceae bacterium]|jgi:uncharacterized glyoxalase superfamily protein PhnB|nr:hypothetical protein [Bryobacteraceae bacterium]
MLRVNPSHAAKAFYVEGLGFHVTFEASEDSRSGLLGVELGDIRLTLDSPMSGHARNACVGLEVDGEVLRAPQDEEWDARTFDLLDHSGNTIFVMGPVRERAGTN